MSRARVAALMIVAALAIGSRLPRAQAASATENLQAIGLGALYQVLFTVANCPNVELDEPAFRRVARLYHLTPADLTIEGAFSAEIAQLASEYRVRFEEDRMTFCDMGRLRFAVPYGVLVDRGPEQPHPLPFLVQP